MRTALFFLLLAASLCAAFEGSISGLSEDELRVLDMYPNIKDTEELRRFISAMVVNVKQAQAEGYLDDKFTIKEACPKIPTPAPTSSVHSLKPGHIKVIFALGDSITAAMSAKDSTVLLLREYRGIAFNMGGDPGVVTVPNILHNFTTTLIGMSTGIGKRDGYTGNGLNAAVSGSRSQNMTEQAQWFVSTLAKRADINATLDWKMMTIWIGSNNLCDLCHDAVYNGAEAFYTNVRAALQYIWDYVPRVLINILPMLDVTDLYKFSGLGCAVVHPIACPCGTSSDNNIRNTVQLATANFSRRVYDLARDFNSKGATDKAIVVQPFLINTQIPERRYLSAADCFHPAPVAHENLAVAFWNSLLTPVETKRLEWVPGEQPLCPTAETEIPTCPSNNPSCCNPLAKSQGYC